MLTAGSRGDVQPYAALGVGLKQAGHQVTLATHELFREFVSDLGLEFKPLAGDPQELLSSERGQEWVQSGQNSLAFLANFIKLTRPYFRQQLQDCQRAAEGADLLLFSPFTGGGMDVAEKMGIPVALTAVQPFHATRAFPAMGAFGTFGVPFLNYGSHRTTEYLMWLPFRDIYNRWRQEDLGLPPRGLKGPMTRMQQYEIPTLYGYSPSLIPRPEDWAPWIHVTGYWYLDQVDDWQPPARLRSFLEAGDPPVYLGFGSMIHHDGDSILKMARHVADALGCRMILQRGWQKLAAEEESERILVIDSTPHSWLFPKMAAVVHHGGAGTTAAGLRAGVPSLLVPHFADQFFWADWVARREAGPPAIPRKELSAGRLIRAIERALEDQRLRAHAAALGASIRSEHGVHRAADLVESIGRQDPPW